MRSGNFSCSAADLLALRRVTLMEAMETVDCVASPVAMAEAIVPHPRNPMRRGASGSVHAVLTLDEDKEVLELAWGAMLNVEREVAKARVQDRNNGRSKSVEIMEADGRSILKPGLCC